MPNPRRSSWSKKGICCGPVGIAQESRIPSAPVLLPPSVQRVASSTQDISQAVSERKPEAVATARVKELANKARLSSSNAGTRRSTVVMEVGSQSKSTPKKLNRVSLQGTTRLTPSKGERMKKANGMVESTERVQTTGVKTSCMSRQRVSRGDSRSTTQKPSAVRRQSTQQEDGVLIKNCARKPESISRQSSAAGPDQSTSTTKQGQGRKETANSSGRGLSVEHKQRKLSTSQTKPTTTETRSKTTQQQKNRRLPPTLPNRAKNEQPTSRVKKLPSTNKQSPGRIAKNADLTAPTAQMSEKERQSAKIDRSSSRRREAKSEMSLWKKFKQMSSKTLRSRTRGDDSSESSGKVVPKEKRMIFIGPSMSRRKSYPSAAHSDEPSFQDAWCESICTGQPLPSKNDPEDVSPVSPRSLTITHGNDCPVSTPTRGVKILQRCTVLTPEPSPETVFPRVYDNQRCEIQEAPLFPADADSAEIIDDSDSHSQFVFTPGNAHRYRLPEENIFSIRNTDLLQTQSSSLTEMCTGELRMHQSPRRIFSNPLISVSPELPTSRSLTKAPTAVESLDPCLRIPNMPSDSTSEALLATLGSYTPCRSDSSQIGAHCEWIRETLKEESKRLMTMTNMLEALQTTPRPSTSVRIDNASNQDLNRRYIEKINDLQFENRHLRQLLEFAIGTMKKESWVPTPVPPTPCRGPYNNSPIAVFDHSDTDSEKKAASNDKQEKKNRGKAPTTDPQYIANLTESLDSKEQHLRFIEESAAQITTLREWYDKRLNELERDRERLQIERADCVNELRRCGKESYIPHRDNRCHLNRQPLRTECLHTVNRA